MSDLLQELVGQEVTIRTSVGSSRTGTLQDVGVRWIHLMEEDAGTLLIQIGSIRLIKIIGSAMTTQAAIGEFNFSTIGRTVSVTSKACDSGITDTGKLEAFDNDWLRIRKKNDQLYFPVSSIVELRLVPE